MWQFSRVVEALELDEPGSSLESTMTTVWHWVV